MLYDDVRKVVYRQRMQRSRKSAHPTLSVQLWIEQIQEEGGKGMFEDQVADNPNHYLFAWCTKFQLKASVFFLSFFAYFC